jgi:signal transduction histidine kinase
MHKKGPKKMPNKIAPEFNFSTILGCSVHDMKNSLGIIQDLVSQLAKGGRHSDNLEFGQLEFESNRMNNILMQLLVLYKIDHARFSLNIDEYPVEDLLNEAVAQQEVLLALNSITIEVNCEADLYCYCDFNIITSALGTILNNAQRYARQKILFSAKQEGQFLIICIEDDGEGYPETFFLMQDNVQSQVDFNTGSTGLGLFFAQTIAAMHCNGTKRGSIAIDNNSTLGGARFKMILP